MCLYIYVYIYICHIHTHTCVYIHEACNAVASEASLKKVSPLSYHHALLMTKLILTRSFKRVE